MKRLMIVLLGVGLVLCLGGVAAASQWYDVTFTGADIWNIRWTMRVASPRIKRHPDAIAIGRRTTPLWPRRTA